MFADCYIQKMAVVFKKILLVQVLLTSSGIVSAAEKSIRYPKEKIIQAILDDEHLQSYLRPNMPNRVPVVVSDHLIGRSLKLKKFNQPVLILSDEKVKTNYLRFTAFDCKNGNYCNISFEYPIEGLTGGLGVWIKPDGSLKIEKFELSVR